MIQTIDYWAIAPPLILTLVAGLILLLDLFPLRRWRLSGPVALAGVGAALAVLVAQASSGPPRRTFCLPEQPGSCSYVLDRVTLVFAGITLVAGVIVVLLSMAELTSGDIPTGEWYFLLLCVLAGAVTLPASRDLIMLVVALELVSLPVFALTALRRYDGRAAEAAVKLFLVSIVSTAVTLLGISLLYGSTGAVHLDQLAETLTRAGAGPVLSETPVPASTPVLAVAVVLVLVGFGVKVAAVPVHFWAADVYQGAPIPVAAPLSVISKAAGIAGFIVILTMALPSQATIWTPIVGVLAALTMTVGNLLALRQRNAIRLLAWSSVAQSGFVLAPFARGSGSAVSAASTYLIFYAAMNLTAFTVVMAVSRWHPQNELANYRGLSRRNPAAALTLAFALTCLAGLPPGLAGMFAKIVVFREIVTAEIAWLAVVLAVNTVIGLYYYLAWTIKLFQPDPGERRSRFGSLPATAAITLAVGITVVFSIAPQLVLSATG